MTLDELKQIIKEEAVKIITELKASSKYKIGEFTLELTKDNQVAMKNKDGRTIKIQDVSPSFDQRDLMSLANKLSLKQKTKAIPV